MAPLLHRRVLLRALAAGLVPAALVPTPIAAGPKSDKVTLSEFKVSPSPKSISAGKVTFSVKNAGDDEHELVIIKTSTSASKLKVSSGRASERGKVAEVDDIAGGRSKSKTVTLKKGHYALICNLPGHYQQGMRA